MTDAKEKIKQILDKDQLSAEESRWLLSYIENTDQHELQDILKAEFDNNDDGRLITSDKLLAQIHKKLNIREKPVTVIRKIWVKVAVAASIIGLLLYAGWFYKDSKVTNVADNHKAHPTVVKPVAEKAILALEDGSKIILGKVKNGTVINQSNANITKTDGKLAYNSNANTNKITYNTLTTPHGGHYRLDLPDGTKVWLNTASSISYPTTFTGSQRLVKITGEAYFEVAKNKKMPFIVSANNSQIRVYGTHFNVMAYNDEATVKTSLLEGSVKCTNGQSSCMLKPGEQSELGKNGQYKVSPITDLNSTVAWKNGLFHFENADIESVMRQLEREYDVTVTYNKKINDHFFAEVPLNSSLADVLKVLQLTGKVHFEVKDKQIIVNP